MRGNESKEGSAGASPHRAQGQHRAPTCLSCGAPMVMDRRGLFHCAAAHAKPSRFLTWFIVIAGLLGWALFLCGCTTTVTAPHVKPRQASFDGNVQNSGALTTSTNGLRMTLHARDRYNALVAEYGGYFQPPLRAGDGVSATEDPQVFLLDEEHEVKFMIMNRWRMEGREPKPSIEH